MRNDSPQVNRTVELARLVAAASFRMQALIACMRKLVMSAYGVFKNRKPFDPKWASRITT